MSTRVALIGIVVNSGNVVEQVNSLLHANAKYIVGRMGIPYRERGVNIMSIVIDAPDDVITALAGKLGMLSGVSAKTVYPKV